MAVLKCIAKEFNHAVIKTCSDAGCTLKLSGLKDYIVLKGEVVYQNQPVCDCIIFVEHKKLLAGVVELKSKTVDVSKVRLQLANGLKIVFKAFNKCGIEPEQFKCFVVVLAKKWRKSEYNVIKSKKVEFQGRKYYILPKRCGVSFAEIISKF
jgi:hypothetical protein